MSTITTPDVPARGYAPQGKDNGIVKSKGTVNLPPPTGGESVAHRARKPEWLKVRAPGSPNYLRLKELMRSQGLHTVCEEAHCPNIGECWESGTATFMILGDVCTRACKYCAVAHGLPTELDEDEPRRVADSVVTMGLEHAVITSVNRDELKDGGAAIYAECIRQIHERVPGCSVEVLIPDLKGNEDALRVVVEARPEILAHNIDTVERLAKALRPGARYWRSISFLGAVKRMNPAQLTKSAIILGMGETEDEIYQSMKDLREASVDILTLGQYLRPSEHHVPLDRWVHPDEFRRWKEIGERELGFGHVESGPLVRSSYHAKEQARTIDAGGPGSITHIVDADVDSDVQIDASEAALRAAMVRPPAPRLVQIGGL
ncbi:MAG: Lipoyl synthase [uncultured Gemmatimonadetes bacterium]|uniref:Lipoyl synthase n=1 Tax=uncultured Gemmatimonadota bacterium TaxID=203437 RepID=A0A6J4MPM1_9BACT|nr:MAG: Lipoyl synthase [uncultured Gemmatimonadota bacterium]